MRIKHSACVLFAMVLFAGSAQAAEIKVMISGGFSAAYEKLVPEFERATGHKVTTERGPRWARHRRRSPTGWRAANMPTW